MEKIKFITDSACDLPEELARQYDITVLPIPITVDGVGYLERVDFTPQEFYHKLLEAKTIPTTSHITAMAYCAQYADALAHGCTHVVNITINSGGSNMFQAAALGKQLFYEEYPAARGALTVEIVDSKTYTMAYGYPIWQAAIQAAQGVPCAKIVEDLHDFFDRLEIYFATYTLEFVKKSGRVSCAAAFVGDVLGLRPVISIIDGETKVVDKVRGDKNVVPRLCEIGLRRRQGSDSPILIFRGLTDGVGEQLQSLVEEQTGAPVAGLFHVGASIAINAGPRLTGLMVLGEKRGR